MHVHVYALGLFGPNKGSQLTGARSGGAYGGHGRCRGAPNSGPEAISAVSRITLHDMRSCAVVNELDIRPHDVHPSLTLYHVCVFGGFDNRRRRAKLIVDGAHLESCIRAAGEGRKGRLDHMVLLSLLEERLDVSFEKKVLYQVCVRPRNAIMLCLVVLVRPRMLILKPTDSVLVPPLGDARRAAEPFPPQHLSPGWSSREDGPPTIEGAAGDSRNRGHEADAGVAAG